MESTRTYTFRRIIILLLIFISGFAGGRFINGYDRSNVNAESIITKKRFDAIRKAVKQGKTEYEFEIGYTPVLNN